MTRLLEGGHHPDINRLLRRYPTAIRSSRWDDMVGHISAGRFDDALHLAQNMESRPAILQQNVVSRRMRLVRVSLFALLREAEIELRQIFQETSAAVVDGVMRWGDDESNIPKLKKRNHEAIVELRRRIRTWMRRIIWDCAKLGLKNSEDALMPIFQRNWEALREDRFSFDMDVAVANRNTPKVKISSDKWSSRIDKIVAASAKNMEGGFDLSQRIYNMTRAAELEVDRLVVSGIVDGRGTDVIARSMKQYFSPRMTYDAAGAAVLPRGAYYSPFKNALRVARTETVRVYTQTTAEYAKDKWWIKGVMLTRTHAGEPCDQCDPLDGEVMSAEEFAQAVPVHPHCMCYPTYVFDDKIFADDEVDE